MVGPLSLGPTLLVLLGRRSIAVGHHGNDEMGARLRRPRRRWRREGRVTACSEDGGGSLREREVTGVDRRRE